MQVLKGTLSRGKRGRDLESAQTLSEKRNLHVYLEHKAELAVQGESAAHRRLSEAEADMNIRDGEPKNSDMALYESCITRINGLIRLEKKRSGYLENWT